MSNRRRLSILIALAAFLTGASAASAAPLSRTVDLRVDPAGITWTGGAGGLHLALAAGAPAAVAGAPDLPVLPVTVVPPAGYRLVAASVRSSDTVPLRLPRELARYGSPGETAVMSTDPADWPLVRVSAGGYLRGMRLDGIVVSPVRPGGGGDGSSSTTWRWTSPSSPTPGWGWCARSGEPRLRRRGGFSAG